MYLVYRIYSQEERPDISDRSIFYGWSKDKSMIKVFVEQRSKKKYKVCKIDDNDISKIYPNEITCPIDDEHMIDFIILQSSSTGDEYHFFTTAYELCNTEKLIQRMVREHISLGDNQYSFKLVNLFYNLDEYYLKALLYIGFKPEDLDILFPSADYHDDINNIQTTYDEIDDAYNTNSKNIIESLKRRPGGLMNFEDVSNKIVYSLESFIKVLKNDL